MKAERILELLPWRPPFLMIDALTECIPHEQIVTVKRVTSGDPLAGGQAGNFPRTLLLEGMGQSAALLFRISRPADAADAPLLLGWLRASVHGTARAGDCLVFEVRSVKMTSQGGVFEARARVENALVAEAELAFATGTRDDDAAKRGSETCS